MKTLGQLIVREIKLEPGQECVAEDQLWRLMAVSSGAAYWLEQGGSIRSLAQGQLIVTAPNVNGTIRASRLNEVLLHSFLFQPNLVRGFLSLWEWEHFKAVGENGSTRARFLPSSHPASQRMAALAAVPAGENDSLLRRLEALAVVALVFWERQEGRTVAFHRVTTALDRFQALIARMSEAEILIHTPGELAQICGCTRRHFNRLFRRYFHASARERQAEIRSLLEQQISIARAIANQEPHE